MSEVLDIEAENIGDLFDGGGAALTDHRAERALLGYLLRKPGAVTETLEILQPRDLHDPHHQRIYELLLRCYDIGEPPTMLQWNTLFGDKVAGPIIAGLISEADAGIDIGEVADHIATISERRAVGNADDDYIQGEGFTSRFGAMRWEDIGTDPGTQGYTWLIEDVVPMGEITLAYGDSGSGKTFGMFDMSMASARGLKLWNGRNVEQGLVVYVAAEAGKGFKKRKVAYALQHQLEATEPLPFVLITKRPDFFRDDSDAVALIEEIKQIARMYRQRLVLIVLDTLSAAAPGMNENASQDVSMVRRRLVMLQDQFTAAVCLVHHKPKNGSTPRGHGSLTADFETTIEFETLLDKKTDTGKTIHKATVRKQREGKPGIAWEFTLPVIEVGRNKWGNPETSCVVEPYAIGQRAPSVGFHATSNEKLFLRAMYDAISDHGVEPPVGLPKSITKVVEHRYVRPLMRERMIAPHEDSSLADSRFRQAYSRAGTKLRDGGVIGVQGNLIWPTGKPVQGFSEGGSNAA